VNVGLREARIFRKNLRHRHSRGQQIEDEGYPYTMTADAGFAEAPLRVDPNALEKFLACHGESLAG
jgi:hypothetical protein